MPTVRLVDPATGDVLVENRYAGKGVEKVIFDKPKYDAFRAREKAKNPPGKDVASDDIYEGQTDTSANPPSAGAGWMGTAVLIAAALGIGYLAYKESK